jgi:hypothetical protein
MSEVKKTEAVNVDRVVKATHWLATIGSPTEQGGRVSRASSGLEVGGLTIALIDDVVTYEDGSEAVIIDGAGVGATYSGKPCALVGSRLSNGDRIIASLQNKFGIDEYHDSPIPGLFDPSYTQPITAAMNGANIDA